MVHQLNVLQNRQNTAIKKLENIRELNRILYRSQKRNNLISQHSDLIEPQPKVFTRSETMQRTLSFNKVFTSEINNILRVRDQIVAFYALYCKFVISKGIFR